MGMPQGDHPLELFKEAYSAPVSVKPEDSSCGAGYKGTTLDDYCQANPIGQRPPCLPGQRGCSCRSFGVASQKCDFGLECTDAGFCARSTCPAGTPGCKCNNGACDAGTSCSSSDNICYYNTDSNGQLGGSCSGTQACAGGASCVSGVCLIPSTSSPVAGTAGAICNNQLKCNSGDLVCDTNLNMCVKDSVCSVGSGGCTCNKGRCAFGFECKANGQCGAQSCEAGTIGCPCAAGDSCSNAKLQCLSLRIDGSEKACLGTVSCSANQVPRCKSYCGANNVRTCPLCDYILPTCFTSAAVPVAVSSSLLILAALLALLL